jgi:hypothetical protein
MNVSEFPSSLRAKRSNLLAHLQTYVEIATSALLLQRTPRNDKSTFEILKSKLLFSSSLYFHTLHIHPKHLLH